MVKVRRSTVIDAPIDEVWRFLRDFNGHERWHPAVAESRIEEGRAGDAVGAVRRFRLEDGAQLREQLLSLSDRDRRFTYCILDAPMPLIGYVATVELKPVTDANRTYWEWRSEFQTPPGQEAAGIVLDVGEGVAGFGPGDRVAYGCLPVGAYAEARTLPADLVVPLPDAIADETAAAGLLKGMTAEFLLHRCHVVKEGDVVLVHAAAGGVGLLLCQWASHLGATVIGTVGSREKGRLALAHGCAHPILYREQDFVACAMEITGGRGVDVVYDAVGRDSVARSYEALAPRGHIVSYGQAAGLLEPLDIASFASKSAKVSRSNYGHYAGTAEQVRASSARLFSAIERGILRVEIGQRFAMPPRPTAASKRARPWDRRCWWCDKLAQMRLKAPLS